MKKVYLSAKKLLSKNGYTEKIIEEIYQWYNYSGTNS